MRVYLDSVGCRLNQAELEAMGRSFRAWGAELVASPEEAELAVINTCTVTARADRDSRARVRRLHRANPALQIVVTGCWATAFPEQAAALPGVEAVVDNRGKARIPELFVVPGPAREFPGPRLPLPGPRRRLRAFVKVQDGCDHGCTYCITTRVRGPSRSRTVVDVVEEVDAAWRGGAPEVVLTGVQLSAWGRDLRPRLELADLLEALLEREGPRIRLSSLEPWAVRPAWFRLWSDPRLCPQLHLPLQSGSARVLRRMARPLGLEGYRELVAAARELVPGVALTTDLLVGFPGETERDFEESLAFVENCAFAGAHVFPYSPRPGTPAARFPGRVPREEQRRRVARTREVVERSARAYRESLLGRELSVLWIRARALEVGYALEGVAGNGLRLGTLSRVDRTGLVDRVRVTGSGDPLEGELVEGDGSGGRGLGAAGG